MKKPEFNYAQRFLVWAVRLYRRFLSPDRGLIRALFPGNAYYCAFNPSCSEYAIEALERYGAIRGFLLTTKRILRCHPWQKNHFDPLP